MNKYYSRSMFILIIILAISIWYLFFKESVHLWFCENEGNGASCSIIGMIHDSYNEYDPAEKYLRKSCQLRYGIRLL